MMKAITAFVSGLLLSTLLLLPASVRAAELQPFFTLKLSSVNSLVSVAEKIGTMAGFADNAGFREVVQTCQGLKGVDLSGIAGLAAAENDGEISMMLLLPITDLMTAEVPGRPDIFDSVRPFLVKTGEGKFEIASPIGTFIAFQKKNYLVIASENVASLIPADAKKLFADLDKYTLGIKVDLEKVEFETLEGAVFGPIIMMTSMANPEAAEQLNNMLDIYRELYKEFSVASGGIAFDSRTADFEYSGMGMPRKGSDLEKTLAGYKQLPTQFSGFRGTPGNTVFSIGDAASAPPFPKKQNAFVEPALQQYETLLEGFLEQIAEEDESGETGKWANAVFDSIRKIIDTESKRGASDTAASIDTDGTALLAFETGSLEEIRNLTSMVVGFGGKRVPENVKELIAKNLQRDYATVEGFKVSSLKIAAADAPSPPAGLEDLTLGVFWAVKESGSKQAIAAAAGLDFAKTEQAFKSALEKTKTSAPAQKPMGILSIQGLGKFLQQTVYPVAAKTGAPPDNIAPLKKVADIFASAESDATVTLSFETKADRIEGGYHVSGKAIQAVVSAVKAVMESFAE